jgi:hypothetical protein
VIKLVQPMRMRLVEHIAQRRLGVETSCTLNLMSKNHLRDLVTDGRKIQEQIVN